MPICLIGCQAHKMGKVASPSSSRLLDVLVPIVPITYLLNVVVIRSKGILDTYKRIYTRKSLNCLGTVMGTRRFLCAKN
jgi:hypothetical protein